jgi:DNA-binding protein HU-beta
MNKEEFIGELAKETGLTKKDSRKVLNMVLNLIINQCGKGERVVFIGFGTFDVMTRKATTKKDPRTGKEIKVPSKKVPRFRPGRGFRDAVAK